MKKGFEFIRTKLNDKIGMGFEIINTCANYDGAHLRICRSTN